MKKIEKIRCATIIFLGLVLSVSVNATDGETQIVSNWEENDSDDVNSVIQIIGNEEEKPGLFDEIINQEKKNTVVPMPSYSVFRHVAPAKTDENEKTITYYYNNVLEEDFSDFGKYLDDKGYSINKTEKVNNVNYIEIVPEEMIEDESRTFVITYDFNKSKMTVIYPLDGIRELSCKIEDMNYTVFGGGMDNMGDPTDVVRTNFRSDKYGNEYESSFSVDHGAILIPLNKKWKQFTGTVAFPGEVEYNSSKNCAIVAIYADDNLIFTSPEMNVESLPVDFDLDVSTYTRLKIVWYSKGLSYLENWGYQASIFDGLFIN